MGKDENKDESATRFIYTFMFIDSMSKLISVSDDVYSTLTQLKGEESYSVVLRKLLGRASNTERILGFFGKGGMDEQKIKEVQPTWKKWSEKYA